MGTVTEPKKKGYIPYPKPVVVPERDKVPERKPVPVPA
jgi:hypothetical protein